MKSLLFGLCMIMVTIQLSYQQCPSASFNPSESRCQLLKSHSDSRPTPVTYPLATLAEGQSFEIRGTATANNAFGINFVNAENNNINGFHMSFRTNLNQLVFNFHTKLDAWDYSKEQKTDIVPVVGDYVVLVHLANNQWNVLVNGKRASYAVNVPYNQLNGLYFYGPFNVKSVRQFASFTEPCPFSQSSCTVLSASSTTQSTPVTFPLLNFVENNAVEIRGNANSIFSVDFVNSNDRNINAFHLSFRLNLRELVYNFFTKVDAWDYSKEKKPGFAPVAGDYVIVVRATKDQWQVSVNGVHSSSYPVNVPYNQVNALSVTGGISVTSIRYFSL